LLFLNILYNNYGITYNIIRKCRVGVVTRPIPGRGYKFFSSPLHPDWLWGPCSLLSNGCEVDHSPLPWAKVKNVWSYTSTPPHVFMMCCLVKHRDNFIIRIVITSIVEYFALGICLCNYYISWYFMNVIYMYSDLFYILSIHPSTCLS